MMSYAINATNTGWRAINSEADLLPGETYSATQPVLVPTLAQVQASQITALQSDYAAAVSAPVSFKNAAGVTSTYPAGNTLISNGMTAQQMLSTILAGGASAWTLGKWLDSNGVAQTFTFADVQGLAAAVEAVDAPDYMRLVALIAQVQAATTVTAVQAIKWTS